MWIFLLWILFPGKMWEHRSGISYPMERLGLSQPRKPIMDIARAQLTLSFSCGQWVATGDDL